MASAQYFDRKLLTPVGGVWSLEWTPNYDGRWLAVQLMPDTTASAQAAWTLSVNGVQQTNLSAGSQAIGPVVVPPDARIKLVGTGLGSIGPFGVTVEGRAYDSEREIPAQPLPLPPPPNRIVQAPSTVVGIDPGTDLNSIPAIRTGQPGAIGALRFRLYNRDNPVGNLTTLKVWSQDPTLPLAFSNANTVFFDSTQAGSRPLPTGGSGMDPFDVAVSVPDGGSFAPQFRPNGFIYGWQTVSSNGSDVLEVSTLQSQGDYDSTAVANVTLAGTLPVKPAGVLGVVTKLSGTVVGNPAGTVFVDLGTPAGGHTWSILSVTVVGADAFTNYAGSQVSIMRGTAPSAAANVSDVKDVGASVVPSSNNFPEGFYVRSAGGGEHLYVQIKNGPAITLQITADILDFTGAL
jgi:hypothetical protein